MNLKKHGKHWERLNTAQLMQRLKAYNLGDPIYVVEDIAKGEPLLQKNIRIIRPGDGGPPSLYNDLIGISSPKSFKKATPLTLDKILE